MKKYISLLLAVLMALSVFSAAGFSALADDDDIVPLELNTKYTEAFEKTDEYNKKDKKYYDYFVFTVPANGKITLTISSKFKGYTSKYARYYIFPSKGDEFWSPDNKNFKGKWNVNLKKGKYFLVAEYTKTSKEEGKMLGGTYNLKLAYKPTINKTEIKKATPKTEAFKVMWKQTKGAAGYIVQYSRYKDFKKSEKIEVIGAKTLSTTVKELVSGKNYYVRVCGFRRIKIADKKKYYYGKWSKTLKVKVE